jgi:hypothetical protein
MVLIPATASTVADWCSFVQTGSGVRQLLHSANAQASADSVLGFMTQRDMRTWNEFLLDFDDYARAHLESPSTTHQPLLRLVIMQRMVGAVQRELFKLQEVFYKPDPRLLSQPPTWMPAADGLHDHFELH